MKAYAARKGQLGAPTGEALFLVGICPGIGLYGGATRCMWAVVGQFCQTQPSVTQGDQRSLVFRILHSRGQPKAFNGVPSVIRRRHYILTNRQVAPMRRNSQTPLSSGARI
jgi:hypothetical protein